MPRIPTVIRPASNRMGSPTSRLNNMGSKLLMENRMVRQPRAPRLRTNGVRNIYRPNPRVTRLI